MSHLLLLITSNYLETVVTHALDVAYQHINATNNSTDLPNKVSVFFYSDGAHIANAFNWQPADKVNVQQAWQQFAKEQGIILNVCVSTALTRGITNVNNSKRHQLYVPNAENTEQQVLANNLAEAFELVGLGVLAELMHEADVIKQF